MIISMFKFGKNDTVTVKYGDNNSEYALTTGDDPGSSLYQAATDVAEEAKDVMGFTFTVSFSGLAINFGKQTTATIILDAAAALDKTAEIKCPQISRKRVFCTEALDPVLPGLDANTVPVRYAEHIELNLAIDVFLKEAAAFVKNKNKRPPELFDNIEEGDTVTKDDQNE
jgi:hypothetical protein